MKVMKSKCAVANGGEREHSFNIFHFRLFFNRLEIIFWNIHVDSKAIECFICWSDPVHLYLCRASIDLWPVCSLFNKFIVKILLVKGLLHMLLFQNDQSFYQVYQPLYTYLVLIWLVYCDLQPVY